MSNNIPRAVLILDYEMFFSTPSPLDRVSLIKHISRESILTEVAALNYRLKPKDKIHIDESLETQIKELKYFTKTEQLFKRYGKVASRFTKNEIEYPLFFTRQTCLFAIEEIINSDEMVSIDDFTLRKVEDWEAILKYLLAVNYHITQIKKEEKDASIDFEVLNPKLLPLNELSIETDPILTPYRGFRLIEYILNETIFSDELRKYFKEFYGIEPQQLIFHLLSIYMTNRNPNPDFDFFYMVQEGYEAIFDKLSTSFKNLDTFKLVSIKKSPLIKIDNLKYVIADNSFLVEKVYSQLVNDFWFDWIRKIEDGTGKKKYNIRLYRSMFGYFFENYISKILANSFKNYRHSKLLMFDELKIKTEKQTIEIADIYFRYGKKILLGQVKSTSIYDKEKFGGDLESLYKNDRNKFFKTFGVNQIVGSIKLMEEHIISLDRKFPKNKVYDVFPVIVFNDKALQTALMADIFNKRFQELLERIEVKSSPNVERIPNQLKAGGFS